jgi:AraC-like DNA-binding protein
MHVRSFPIQGVEFYGEWKPGKKLRRLAPHKNPGLEIVLVSKGEPRWKVEDREVKLRANTLFYTLPWQEHGGAEETQPNCEISYLCIKLAKRYEKPRRRFQFHPALGFTPAEERVISCALTRPRTQAIPAGDEAAWLFSHLFQVARGPVRLRRTRVRETIKLLIAYLADLATAAQTSESRIFEAERRVREFTALLAERHAEPWTLKAMSDTCRLGRTQFAQLLKKHTGDTPMTHLNRLRIREAQRLIIQSNRSITEIALEVGFNSSQYFATVFKEFTDLDPRGFRAKNRN